MNEITDAQIKDATAFFIANPDKIPADLKAQLANVLAPKQAVQQEQQIEMTNDSKNIASSIAALQNENKQLKETLKQREALTDLALTSALKEQELQYIAKIKEEEDRNKIISKLYRVMPRDAVDKMVADGVTTDNMTYLHDAVLKSGATLAGVAKGFEIRSSVDNMKEQITKLGYSEITFDKGMVD